VNVPKGHGVNDLLFCEYSVVLNPEALRAVTYAATLESYSKSPLTIIASDPELLGLLEKNFYSSELKGAIAISKCST